MAEKVSKDILEKIETERDEYNKGFNTGVQFAKENTFSIIEAVISAIDNNNMDRFCQVIRDEKYEVYCDSSPEYQKGFQQALKEIIKRSVKV